MSFERVFKSFIASPVHVVAYPLSLIFFLILKIKNFFLKQPEVIKGPLVISVGSIDFGGSGKTPTLLFLLKYFENYSCAVISRGYKSQLEHKGSTYINMLVEKDAKFIGDEPLLINAKFPKVNLYVGKDKVASLKACQNQDFVFLDDGAQSKRIKKDISIILIDPSKPIKPLFPAGYRRDLLDTLKTADFVAIPYCESQAMYEKAKEVVQKYTQVKTCGFTAELMVPTQEKKIALLTAIAKPLRLKKQLESLGYKIVYWHFLDDHQEITDEIIQNFETCALKQEASALCMTEKDIVKVPEECKNKFSIITLKLIPSYDINDWESFIGKIQKMS